jgi:LmbE family N-acetylglucosaminyl deacetylase
MAHPDDVEFLCAGTLARLRLKGWAIHLATMTAGDCGSKTLPTEKLSVVRQREAQASAQFLRASYTCVGCLDLRIMYDTPTLQRVVEVVRRTNPTIVFTHSPSDYMVDHETTAQLVRTAVFTAPAPNFHTDAKRSARATQHLAHLYYADAVEGRNIFGEPVPPHFRVDVTSTMKTKERMLKCHVSQRAWLRVQHGMDEYIEAMKRWSAQRGREAGVAYAEAFRQHLGHPYPQNNLLGEVLGKVD